MKRRRTLTAVAALALCLAPSACMMFCPKPSPHQETTLGEVKMLDFPTCRRMRVVGHEAEFNGEKRLVVRVHWLNVGERSYRAEIRVRFLDENALAERGSFRWDLQPFPPGESTCEWTSYTQNAARYSIEVRHAR